MRLALCILFLVSPAWALDADEFKVKRQEVFEFAERPVISGQGDRIEIRFASKGYCDATVAVEDGEGRIVRHLVSGVLGPNAPQPFARNSLSQAIVWDGKDDQGRYVDKREGLKVRVSLGLKPRFERTLFWSPYKRISSFNDPPLIQAAPEGVYVLDSKGTDHLRLYDHRGEYVRTTYPFPADRLRAVDGLKWNKVPQDGLEVPVKNGIYQCTLLTSGVNATLDHSRKQHGLFGSAATAMAIGDSRIVLAHDILNRFSADGATWGVPLAGPKVTIGQIYGGGSNWREERGEVTAKSIALSPDSKWLYLAGYTWDKYRKDGWYHFWHCTHGVLRMAVDGDRPPELFAGSLQVGEHGAEDGRFRCAVSVACDRQGRVYVADYMNNRVQVFSPDGKHLRNVPVARPVKVLVHQRTGEIYVFSWMLANQLFKDTEARTPAEMTRFTPLDNPTKISSCPLGLEGYVDRMGGFKGYGRGHYYRAELDSWSDPPVIWLVGGTPSGTTEPGAKYGSMGQTAAEKAGIRLLVEKDGRLEVIRDFSAEAGKTLARLKPPDFFRQRLYVNHKNHRLYLAEDLSFNKSFDELVEIDPETSRSRLVPLPYDAEDLAFDLNGLAYLRTRLVVGRFDPATWREVPWDYGEERSAVGCGGGRTGALASGLPLHSGTLWHHGGMSVSAKGHLAVACTCLGQDFASRTDEKQAQVEGRRYEPKLYPGRVVWHKGAIIHVWDEHGRLVHEDAIHGLSNLNGLYIDRDDGLYVMTAQLRILDGGPYFNSMTGTVMKFLPGKGRILSGSDHARIPLPEAEVPKEPPDLTDFAVGRAWVRGAEWLYGGAGFDPVKNNYCACSNSRFAADYFARSFVPEMDRYSVAVLDSSGNLVCRVGRYGNVEDGRPLDPAGGPAGSRSLGGDEVGLFYPAYLATDTDRRLFAADAGNARIVSVRLDYHTTEKVPLK